VSGAQESVRALHKAALDSYRPTVEPGRRLVSSVKAATEATDIILVMQSLVDVIIAAEGLQTAAEAAVKAARAALSSEMQNTGATSIQCEHHGAHLARRQAFLSIDDEALISRDYFVQLPPQLDKKALKAALQNGPVQGASLVTPNDMSLVIRSKSAKS
jgi:hypothetical protein